MPSTEPRNPAARFDAIRRRVADLEAALAHQIALTEQERRRANALEDSARRAWRVQFCLSGSHDRAGLADGG